MSMLRETKGGDLIWSIGDESNTKLQSLHPAEGVKPIM